LAWHALHWNYTVDDAFISFRYAKNLCEGRGLVYNVGERVEGYTNFLWAILMAPPIGLGIDPVVASKLLGLACSAILLLLVAREIDRRSGRGVAFGAGLLLAADPSFALWSVAGLETPLFLLLAFLALRPLLEDGPRLPGATGLWAGLAALTRPEGVLLMASLAGIGIAARARGSAGRALLVFAALVLPHLAFRLVYYGDPLPNTFYAKAGGGAAAWARGGRYLADWLLGYGQVLLVGLAFAGAGSRRARAALALAGVFAIYVVAVGGDGLVMFRFGLFLIVPLALAAAEGAARAARALAPRRVAPTAVALLALAAALPARNSFAGESRAFALDDRARVRLHWSEIGRWLARNARPGETAAVPVAGAIAYYGGITTIDMLGITDHHIARRAMPEFGSGIAGHEKHDMDYVLSRRPTYFIHYPFLLPEPVFTKGQFETDWNPGLAALLTSERFDREYRGEVAEIRVPGAQRTSYLAYFRRKEEAP
jgi:hypothetical protein